MIAYVSIPPLAQVIHVCVSFSESTLPLYAVLSSGRGKVCVWGGGGGLMSDFGHQTASIYNKLNIQPTIQNKSYIESVLPN